MPTIATHIDIDAPADAVWAALTDFSPDRSWDPFFARLDGVAAPGERLTVTITPPQGRGMTFSPTVQVADGRTLAWLGRLWIPGLFDGRHEFVLDPLAGGGTRLTHREVFSGLLTHFGGFGQTRAGFVTFNEALKTRCEKVSPVRELASEPSTQRLEGISDERSEDVR